MGRSTDCTVVQAAYVCISTAVSTSFNVFGLRCRSTAISIGRISSNHSDAAQHCIEPGRYQYTRSGPAKYNGYRYLGLMEYVSVILQKELFVVLCAWIINGL